MIKHYIILASAYSIGKRIVLHFPEKDENTIEELVNAQNFIYETCGKNAPISMHMIQTENLEWNSVTKLDKFFKDTMVIEEKEKFADLLCKDKEISALDLAHYILSIYPCTHLKLQKLVYMCYANYLCEENSKMFNDKIYAYQFGPVIAEIYKKYKKCGKDKLNEDNKLIYNKGSIRLSSRSRILSSEDGIKKLFSINKTLDIYSKLSASELVRLTHKNNTPWNVVYVPYKTNIEITDDIILKYHINEII